LSQKLLFNRPEKQEWREKEDGKFSELLDGNSIAKAYMKGRMSMTTYYSAPELKKMLEYSNRVCQQNDNLVLLKHRVG